MALYQLALCINYFVQYYYNLPLPRNGVNWNNVSSNEQQPRSSAFRFRCRGAGQYNYRTPSAGSSKAVHGVASYTRRREEDGDCHASLASVACEMHHARARVNAYDLKDMHVLRRSPFTRQSIARLLIIDFARCLVSRSNFALKSCEHAIERYQRYQRQTLYMALDKSYSSSDADNLLIFFSF